MINRSLYYFKPFNNIGSAHIHVFLPDPFGPQGIDLQAVAEPSSIKVPTTATEWFRDSLIQRDVCCIFTGCPAAAAEAAHIIPFVKQDEVSRYVLLNTFDDLLSVAPNDCPSAPIG